MLVYGNDLFVSEWVRKRLNGIVDDFGHCCAIGVANNDEIIAGVVYNEYRPGMDIQLSTAAIPGSNWLTKKNLVAFFEFPFLQLRLPRVTSFVPSKNDTAIKFNNKLGFVLEGKMRKALVDDDLLMFGMLKEECRWITEKPCGKEKHT